MIENDHVVLWGRCLNLIRDNVPETTFKTWFEPIVPLKYEDKALTIGVPSPFFYEFLEEKFVDLLRAALYKEIGEGTQLMYCILTDKTNHITVNMEGSKRSSSPPQTWKNARSAAASISTSCNASPATWWGQPTAGTMPSWQS